MNKPFLIANYGAKQSKSETVYMILSLIAGVPFFILMACL